MAKGVHCSLSAFTPLQAEDILKEQLEIGELFQQYQEAVTQYLHTIRITQKIYVSNTPLNVLQNVQLDLQSTKTPQNEPQQDQANTAASAPEATMTVDASNPQEPKSDIILPDQSSIPSENINPITTNSNELSKSFHKENCSENDSESEYEPKPNDLQASWLSHSIHMFKPVSDVLDPEFLERNGITGCRGLMVYVQDARDPEFDPYTLCSQNLQLQGEQGLNIHMPQSRDYIVYYFLRPNTQSRLFKLFQCKHPVSNKKCCEFSIFSMSKYFDHLRTHTGERPFKCNHCDMCFSQKGNLDKHTEMIHFGVAKFVCPHCSKAFTKKFNLQVHLRNILKKANKKQLINFDAEYIALFLEQLDNKKFLAQNEWNPELFKVEKIQK